MDKDESTKQSTGFNITECGKFIAVISDSVLQLTSKKLALEFWCPIKEYPHLPEKVILRYFCHFYPHTCVKPDLPPVPHPKQPTERRAHRVHLSSIKLGIPEVCKYTTFLF